MVYDLLAWVSSFIVNTISSWGYVGVFILMALESALMPIPSEIIMPFSGYLAFLGKFSLWQVVWWGTIGNLIGSVAAYFIGVYGGRPLVEKYGKYILISGDDLDLAEKWFKKYGVASIFFSRLLPVVRTFISLPAGIARMPFLKFCLYTFLGSLPWSFALTYAGVVSGGNWHILGPYFRKFDWAIGILTLLALSWFVYYKIKNNKNI